MGIIKKIKRYWNLLGPGLVTGAADDDPSGIATYSQTGAGFGFKFLWLAPYSFVLMGVVQEMCARIALVTGRGLAENMKLYFSKKWLYACGFFVIVANTLNIGADLGAMSSTVLMFLPGVPFFLPLVVFGLIIILLEVFLSYEEYSKYLKWLAFSLLAYIVSGAILHFDLTELLYHTWVPILGFTKGDIIILSAILGTTISPYLFFWQTSQEVEDEIERGETTVEARTEAGPKEIKQMRADVWGGMLFSNLVMFFIIAVCAATLFKSGITSISSATEAAEALRPIAGNFAYVLFAFGILSTGFLAIPVLAGSSAYIVSETFGFKEGLYQKAKDAKVFYGVITLSVLAGFLFNMFGFNAIDALIYTSVFNAIVAPLALVFVVVLASREDVMGSYKTGRVGVVLGWLTTIMMFVVALATIWLLLSNK